MHRARTEGARDKQHLGLGLYVVEKIVTGHGGHIEVTSTRSEGTTFTVHLPRVFSPAGDLFVVYNHNIRELVDVNDRRRGYAFDSNQLLVKLQYALRY
jgi:hypothetical protein